MSDSDDETPDLPPEIEQLLRSFTGGAELDPQMVEMMRSMGLGQVDPQMLQMVAAQVQAMFSGPPSEGAFDVAQATDIARKTVAASGDALASDADGRAAQEAVSVAGLWLDGVTDLTVAPLHGVAWSRAEWVEATMPVWSDIVEPIAAGVGDAVGEAMQSQLGQLGEEDVPAQLAGMLGQATPLLRRMQGSLFAIQFGQGVGTLAGEIVTGCEVGLPLVPAPSVALLPRAITDFAEAVEVDEPQVRLYLAVREVARARLFGAVSWLAPALLAAVRDYATGIHVDADAIEQAVRSVDPSDPQAMQEAVQNQLFTPAHSPAQEAALGRLEALLALVEGWVDVVTEQAVQPHLPAAPALGETVRRRRAGGGPAEKTFAAMVGLELRPRRMRDAANLFRALESAGGAAARDAAWEHPDLAPTAGDLDDPLGYVERSGSPAADDLDAELDALLRGEGPGSPEGRE